MRNSLTFTCGLRLPACRILVTTISSQSRQENYVSEQDTSSDQHPEIPETKKEPDKTFCRAFWRRATIYGTAIVIAVCIAPSIHFDNEATARFGLAAVTVTLFAFIDLLIYLFAYKEELSGYLFKIFNSIKNFTLHTWGKINSIKKFLKALSIPTGATLLIVAELFLIYKIFEGFSSHAAEIRNLPNDFNFSSKSDELSKIQGIRFNTFLYAIGALILAALPALFFAKKIKSTLEKHILPTFVLTVIIGGILAFLIPTFLYNCGFIGDTKDLTTALLGVTGGVVALFSLIKSHQKSELEREQLDTQKQKDARDHIRQVHAARRDRYIEAIDKLSSEYAPVRLGGVYALVGLVDEWLDDDNIDRETQLKEGQVIINSLCAYIRSPFPLAKNRDILIPSNEVNYGKTFEEDSVRLREEQEIRLSIFTEISNHLTTPEENSENKASTWNEFSYNYRESLIFYPLGNLKFVNPDFSGSEFYGEAVFHNSEFIGEANFTRTRFKGSAMFIESRHNCITKFNNAVFHGETYFIGVKFFSGVSFENSMFGRRIMFSAYSEKRMQKTAFSVKNDPKEYNFEINGIAMVSKIETEQITVADGRLFIIPAGCELFDPKPLPMPKPKEKPAE